MPFDFVPSARQCKGLANHHAGLAAEDCVAAAYSARGTDLVARRWRGKAGEIDLVGRDADGFVFIEVKKARTFAAAAERLSHRQLSRICRTAEEYLAADSAHGLAAMRIDLALVDDRGQVEILQNVSLF